MFGNNLYVNPFDTKLEDGTKYSLNTIDEKGLTKYQVIIDNFPVNIEINKFNTAKLKWIHKTTWIQSDKSNWFKQPLVAGLIGIVGYFIGQSIGLKNGYQDGLKKAQEEFRLIHPKYDSTSIQKKTDPVYLVADTTKHK